MSTPSPSMSDSLAQAETGPRGLLATLGHFASTFKLEDAPEVVIRQARLSILDTVGCMVAGLSAEESRTFARLESRRTGSGKASTVASTRKLDPDSAARINAYLGDVFELNDLTGGHASIAVVPAALAVAEANGSSGRALVEAVIVGIEVTSRVYAAYYGTMKSYEDTGIAPPGIPSTIGAAAAASRLGGLDAAQTAEALSIATALAGWCPAEVIFGQGGTIKPMLFGAWPANVALQAVAYAGAGFDGPARILESRIGLYATLAHSFDERAIKAPAGWHLAQPRRKRHACCGYIHSALDAVIALRAKGVVVADTARLEVGMPAYIIPGVSKSGPPTAPNEARFHAEYCIALAVLGADVIKPEHSIGFDRYIAQAVGVMERIRVTANPALVHYHQCTVRGLDAQGKTLFDVQLQAPRGAPGDPMTDDEVKAKFATLCEGFGGTVDLQSYMSDIDSLERAPTCDWVVRHFSKLAKD